jgi:uncharacterized iron-regulated membrane protein
MQSINEGQFGNADYAVLSAVDLDAAALPDQLDVPAAFKTIIGAARREAPGDHPQFAELRMANDQVVGQLRYGEKELKAFSALNGAVRAPVEAKPLFPPPSARQWLKEWHRFWGPSVFLWRGDVPGVYLELLAGVVLLALIVTGLTVYVRLLKQRRKIKRPGLFWKAGGTWRMLHRGVSVAAALFIIMVAVSGTLLGFESSYHSFIDRPAPVAPEALSDQQLLAMVPATLDAFRKAAPGVAMRVIRMREYHGYLQGVVITHERKTRQFVFDTRTGRSLSLTEPGYPDSQFPWGLEVHEAIKHFHAGYMFGVSQRVMNLIAGVALLYLSISGIVLYFEMWTKRRKAGRKAFFWKG